MPDESKKRQTIKRSKQQMGRHMILYVQMKLPGTDIELKYTGLNKGSAPKRMTLLSTSIT